MSRTTIEQDAIKRVSHLLEGNYPTLVAAVTHSSYPSKNNRPMICISIAEDSYEWNDGHRDTLNSLCNDLSGLGLRWAAELKGNNSLVTKDATGEPWMLFNGGTCIDLSVYSTAEATELRKIEVKTKLLNMLIDLFTAAKKAGGQKEINRQIKRVKKQILSPQNGYPEKIANGYISGALERI